MRLSTIRYIVCIAETGSFTQASARLFVSQPALSQSIQRFEQEIGMALFVREKGRLRLTEAGRIVVEEGRKMLDIERHAYSRLNTLKNAKPTFIRIGSASTYQRFFLTETLMHLQSLHPDIHIRIQEGFSHHLNQMVADGELEFALAFEPFRPQLKAVPIIREEVLLAVPPDSPLRERLPSKPEKGSEFPLADLSLCRDEPFILYPDDRRIQQILLAETARAGFSPQGVITGYSTETANAMAFQGVGLAFVPAVTRVMCPPALRPAYYRIRSGGYYRVLALVSRGDDELRDIGDSLIELLKKSVLPQEGLEPIAYE